MRKTNNNATIAGVQPVQSPSPGADQWLARARQEAHIQITWASSMTSGRLHHCCVSTRSFQLPRSSPFISMTFAFRAALLGLHIASHPEVTWMEPAKAAPVGLHRNGPGVVSKVALLELPWQTTRLDCYIQFSARVAMVTAKDGSLEGPHKGAFPWWP